MCPTTSLVYIAIIETGINRMINAQCCLKISLKTNIKDGLEIM